MALYFVDYDLNGKNKNYQDLYDDLESMGGKRVLESLWALRRDNTTCKSLRERLKVHLDDDDGLMVSEINDWAGRKLQYSPNDL